MTLRWYVVQSKPNQETAVVQNLRNQKFRCFYPQIKLVHKVRGSDVATPAPLFPSYLFVEFDVDRARWRSINGTRGVVKLLSSTEDSVVALPIGLVEDMIEKADKDGFTTLKSAEASVCKFKVGDVLRVKNGIFEGLSGTCSTIRKDCAVVLMALLSGQVGVRLPLNTLEGVH